MPVYAMMAMPRTALESRPKARITDMTEEMKLVLEQFAGVNKRLDGIDAHLDKVDVRLGRMEERLGKVEERLDKVEERLGKVEERLDKVEERLGKVEERLDKVEERLGKVEERLDKVDVRLDGMDRRLTHVENDVRDIHLSLENTIIPNISIVAENHVELNRKLSECIYKFADQELYRIRLNRLEDDMRELKRSNKETISG
jgi:chromosome segregation ATPase